MRFLLFLAFFTWATPAYATSWAALPLEILVDEADVIVVGKVTKIQDGGFAISTRKYDVAVVEVTGLLKSVYGKPREVLVAQPAGKQTRTDIYFQPGQEGIWLLTKDAERDVYWVSHPSQFQQDKEEARVKAMIAARAKLPGGKTVNGLMAWAGAFDSPGGIVNVRIGLKNVSERPIVVCDYLGHRPSKVDWTGPDGKALESKHYEWLNAVRMRQLKSDFVTIPPGGIRFIGARGKQTGIMFLSSAQVPAQFEMRAPPGNNRLTISYVNEDTGKEFGVKNVWTGTVTANEVSFAGR